VHAVLRKELRSLLRERRGWLVPVVYTGLLAAVVALFLGSRIAGTSHAECGQVLAGIVAVVQTMVLFIVAPLAGATTIAGERERGTFLLLLASPVRRRSIVLDKAAAATLYTAVVLAGSLPIATMSLLFGGPDAGALAGLYLTHLIVAAALVCLGVAVSTLFQRTWSATLVAIGLTLALVVFTLALYAAVRGVGEADDRLLTLAINPAIGMVLFLAGDELGGQAQWLAHYAAMLGLAGAALLFAVARISGARA
jgi:ABC-type transport system involved in multi-copper enzyme maturation permease subunit